MTPAQLAEALRVRRRREERALAALQNAQVLQAQAQVQLSAARDALFAFDARLEAGQRAFEERARIGIDPNSIVSMRAFHADQRKARDAFHDPIAMAEGAVAMAEDSVQAARVKWRQASQAAGNLQEMGERLALDAARNLERKQEQDRDEIAATRVMRMTRTGGE